ncbi:hypothetical protein IEQ34_010684 [Dendrobium chrysotoxum]|uniref:Uncharacterized protein n=1 Tax=Dendrobium chrysotoxum TaxID=161865 RepID=A0AAV7GTG2_DENCH|nr:hypothetical protein IEQ34_010684 [Dendrobium chrysotoxum]
MKTLLSIQKTGVIQTVNHHSHRKAGQRRRAGVRFDEDRKVVVGLCLERWGAACLGCDILLDGVMRLATSVRMMSHVDANVDEGDFSWVVVGAIGAGGNQENSVCQLAKPFLCWPQLSEHFKV